MTENENYNSALFFYDDGTVEISIPTAKEDDEVSPVSLRAVVLGMLLTDDLEFNKYLNSKIEAFIEKVKNESEGE